MLWVLCLLPSVIYMAPWRFVVCIFLLDPPHAIFCLSPIMCLANPQNHTHPNIGAAVYRLNFNVSRTNVGSPRQGGLLGCWEKWNLWIKVWKRCVFLLSCMDKPVGRCLAKNWDLLRKFLKRQSITFQYLHVVQCTYWVFGGATHPFFSIISRSASPPPRPLQVRCSSFFSKKIREKNPVFWGKIRASVTASLSSTMQLQLVLWNQNIS